MANKLENLVNRSVGLAFMTGGSTAIFGYELAKENYLTAVVYGGLAVLSTISAIYHVNKIEKDYDNKKDE